MERQLLKGKRQNLEIRSRILQSIRLFFQQEGFLEIQTPIRTQAPAPELHIDAVPSDGWYLATSPELYMKRLLAAGYAKIFQIGPCFRRGETGRLHHSEFTLLEWYRAGADISQLQSDCRRLIRSIGEALDRFPDFPFGTHHLTVAGSWPAVSVAEAFAEWAHWTPGPEPDPDRFDLDLVEKVEPHLGFPAPCFLTDYPAGQAALARLKPDNPDVAERFELYWAGIELANGFTELTDPVEQRRRFETTRRQRQSAGLAVYPMPEAFLDSLQHLDSAAGIALGVDRLVMLYANADRLDEVVAFPPGWD